MFLKSEDQHLKMVTATAITMRLRIKKQRAGVVKRENRLEMFTLLVLNLKTNFIIVPVTRQIWRHIVLQT